MIKLAVFDMDGTICDTIDDLANATNFAMTKLGHPTHDSDAYKYMVGNGMLKLVFRALPEDKRTDDEVDAALKLMMGYYKDHFIDKTHAYNGIPELLSLLKNQGIHIAVCTNKAQDMAEKVADKLFPQVFDLVMGKTDDRPLKPNPFSVKEIMKYYGAEETETVFIGDSSVDMQTAVNSGAIPIGVLWGFRDEAELNENGAKYIAKAPMEIFGIIKTIEE